MKKVQLEQAGAIQVNATAARAEQKKLSKQMRIQNKAKFVSKRIKDSHGGDQQDIDLSSGSTGGTGSIKGGPPQTSLLPSLPAVSEDAGTGLAPPRSLLTEDFISGIEAMTSEAELRGLQKQVMVEKRKLRLEQRQATDGAIEGDAEVNKKVAELTAKEAVILEQIEKVLHKDKEEPQLGGGDEGISLGQPLEPQSAPPVLRKTDSAASVLSRKSHSSKQSGIGISSTHGDVFEQAELLLQAVKVAVSEGPRHHGDSIHSFKDGHHAQPIILLELKISELSKRMPKQVNMDPLGYKDKLHSALVELEKIRHQKEEIHKNKVENKHLPRQNEGTG